MSRHGGGWLMRGRISHPSPYRRTHRMYGAATPSVPTSSDRLLVAGGGGTVGRARDAPGAFPRVAAATLTAARGVPRPAEAETLEATWMPLGRRGALAYGTRQDAGRAHASAGMTLPGWKRIERPDRSNRTVTYRRPTRATVPYRSPAIHRSIAGCSWTRWPGVNACSASLRASGPDC